LCVGGGDGRQCQDGGRDEEGEKLLHGSLDVVREDYTSAIECRGLQPEGCVAGAKARGLRA
jgi:hypothetical protein